MPKRATPDPSPDQMDFIRHLGFAAWDMFEITTREMGQLMVISAYRPKVLVDIEHRGQVVLMLAPYALEDLWLAYNGDIRMFAFAVPSNYPKWFGDDPDEA